MTDPVLETLFYPLEQDMIETAGKRVVFWHARYYSALEKMDVTCVSYWKQDAARLEARGIDVRQDVDDGIYDIALVQVPKNMVEARYAAARALMGLKAGGEIVLAAGNKEGGSRLAKMLAVFGVDDVSVESRNKCRVVWACVDGFDRGAVEAAIDAGGEQSVLDDAYVSWPGVFGWDKIDQGSVLLAQYLPDVFKGRGADFGCGYGYLSRLVRECYAGGQDFYAIDADWRAVDVCTQNAQGVQPVWVDIVAGKGLPERLDFIVMNPPFHAGKVTDSDIGVAFIEQAARCLRRNGVLWMVANSHLPYETVLERSFFKVERLAQENGFKVFKATR